MSLVFYSPAPRPPAEVERQSAVDRAIADCVRAQPDLQALLAEAAGLFGVPVAALSIIDRERQWFAASIGLAVSETPRALSFCAHAIRTPEEVLVVADAQVDRRFAGNPLVLDEPHIRFYAGAPLRDRHGQPLGALCVIDREPRPGLTDTGLLSCLAGRAADIMFDGGAPGP